MLTQTLLCIRRKRPKIGILENVSGLHLLRGDDDKTALQFVTGTLSEQGYETDYMGIDLSMWHAATRPRTMISSLQLAAADYIGTCSCLSLFFFFLSLSLYPSVGLSVCLAGWLSVCLSLPLSLSLSLTLFPLLLSLALSVFGVRQATSNIFELQQGMSCCHEATCQE